MYVFSMNSLIERIVSEARDILSRLGVEIKQGSHSLHALRSWCEVDKAERRAYLNDEVVDQALSTVQLVRLSSLTSSGERDPRVSRVTGSLHPRLGGDQYLGLRDRANDAEAGDGGLYPVCEAR